MFVLFTFFLIITLYCKDKPYSLLTGAICVFCFLYMIYKKIKNTDSTKNCDSDSNLPISHYNINRIKTNLQNNIDVLSIDDYFEDAGKLIIDMNKSSIGMIQRKFKIDFNRAAKIMDQLFAAGVVGPEEGTKPRKILMNKEQFQFLTDNIQAIKLEIGINDNIISESLDRNKSFDNMTGQEFEWFCAKLLEKNGFEDVKVTSASGDFGVDITAIQNYILYAIQCKCYSSDIGVDAVYQASGGMKYYNANVGIVLTNRYFTKQAKELANNIGIILWDRDFLLKLIEKSN